MPFDINIEEDPLYKRGLEEGRRIAREAKSYKPLDCAKKLKEAGVATNIIIKALNLSNEQVANL